MQATWKRKARAFMAALLIASAAAFALPETASAGEGHKYSRHRAGHHKYVRHRSKYRRAHYRPHRYAYRSYRHGYRPYRYVSEYRPRYRAVLVDDPYCYDDVVYVRPVRYRPAVSFVFSTGPDFYGDPYCW